MRFKVPRFVSCIALCCALLLLIGMAGIAAAGGGSQLLEAPLNPVFAGPAASSTSADAEHGLGGRLGPQDLPVMASSQTPGIRNLTALPASYDLRTLNRVTAVRNQGALGTCWAFASLGSLESALKPGETTDFSEDNVVLNSGFDSGGAPYNKGGNLFMSTAYLVRWGGPVNESEDGYGDGTSPTGLTPRKHVQEVDWIPFRTSPTDNDGIKNAVVQYGGVDVSMGIYSASSDSSYYRASTKSYYFYDSAATNHEVVVVGWDDNYPATNFATTPPGNGAFIVRNSWGAAWGDGGYFYISYYDSDFGRSGNPSAAYDNAESTTNYAGIYQYDPLGYCTQVGYSSPTAWFANVFTAQATASLSAVGFYTLAPGTSYEVYTGSSLAAKTLNTSGTIPYMGYHTVTLSTPIGVTSGQPFVVAVKLNSPSAAFPVAVERPINGYSTSSTASAGQSYVSSNGSAWSDLTGSYTNANVCLKAYVGSVVASDPVLTVTAPTSGSYTAGNALTVNWTSDQALPSGEFEVWLRSSTGGWYIGQTVAASGGTSFSTSVTLSVPAGSGYQPIVAYRPTAGSGTWGSWSTGAGSFTVATGAVVVPVLTITAPASGSYTAGNALTVNWTSDQALPSGEFGVWVRSGAGNWYIGKTVAASGGTSFSTNVTLDVPAGSGYQAILAYRPTAGSGTWGSWATSTGSFSVGAS
jgi:C1A family cysteine protease